MRIAATTIEEYLANVPEDRREAMGRLYTTIEDALPPGFESRLGYGMPSWVVPHERYPAGYHCDPKLPLPFLSIASQARHVALYHMGVYADPELLAWFQAEYPKHSKTKLDMGKSCVRWKKPDAIPFALIGDLCSRMTVEQWIARYEAGLRR
jgi:hypothetical protein